MVNIYQLGGTQRMIEGKHGYFVYNRNDRFVGKALELYGEYGEHEVDLFTKLVSPGDLVIEVGANKGSQTVPLSRMAGDGGIVYAFEPQPIVFQNLCANISLNGLNNVRAFPFACGDLDGYEHIPFEDYESEGNFGGVRMQGPSGLGERVSLIRLDGWFAEKNNIRLIKIDVEGMEESVIAGAVETIDRCKPFLYVENDRLEKSKALIETIWELGYKCYWHLPPCYNENNFYKTRQNLYPNIVAVNMLCIPEGGPNVDGLSLVTDSNSHPFSK